MLCFISNINSVIKVHGDCVLLVTLASVNSNHMWIST